MPSKFQFFLQLKRVLSQIYYTMVQPVCFHLKKSDTYLTLQVMLKKIKNQVVL
jgi:hypothetical protein